MDADGRRRSLREKQRQEREELILRAAEEVLLEKGYHSTSIDEIAARVGIAKGTVYLHFASKEALVFALLMRGMQKLIQAINGIIAMKCSARSRLEDILRYVHGELFSEHFQLLYALYESMTARQLMLEKKEYVQSQWEQVAAQITALIDEGKASGELKQEIPTIILTNAFFSMLSPQSYKRLVVDRHMQPKDLVDHLSHIYFHGIAVEKI